MDPTCICAAAVLVEGLRPTRGARALVAGAGEKERAIECATRAAANAPRGRAAAAEGCLRATASVGETSAGERYARGGRALEAGLNTEAAWAYGVTSCFEEPGRRRRR
jgi:hypothetical protein